MELARLDHWCRRGLLAGVGLTLAAAISIDTSPPAGSVWGVAAPAACIAVCWLVRLCYHRAPAAGGSSPVAWLVAALIFVASRYLWVVHRGDAEYAARQVAGLLWMAGLVALAVRAHGHELAALKSIAVMVIAAAAVAAGVGACELLGGGDGFPAGARPDHFLGRIAGLQPSPDDFAGLLVMVLPLALAWLVTGTLGALGRIALGYVAWLMGMGIAFSMCRGAWVAAVVSLGLLVAILWRDHRHRLGAMVILSAAILGAGAFLIKNSAARERLAGSLPRGEFNDSRTVKWPAVVRMIHHRPWFGWGPGQFPSRYPAHRPPSPVLQNDLPDPQSTVLAALVELGWIGTVLAALGGIGIGRELWRRRRDFIVPVDDLQWRGNDRSGLVLGAALGLVAGAVHGMFNNVLWSPAVLIPGAALLGILLAQVRSRPGRTGWVRSLADRWMPATALALLAAGLAGWAVRGGREACWLARASAAGAGTPAARRALERAQVIEPCNPATPLALGDAAARRAWLTGDATGTGRLAAIGWYRKSLAADRHAAAPHTRIGELLHRLGRAADAGPWFLQAINLDPNHHVTRAEIGWHFFDRNELGPARDWFQRSLRLRPRDNDFASGYLQMIDDRAVAERSGGGP